MRTNTTPTSSSTNNAGVPPTPPEAHQRTDFKNTEQRRQVVLSGSRITMIRKGGKWLNIKVEAA